MILGGGGWNAEAVRRHRAFARGQRAAGRRLASAARTCSTTAIPTMPATSASASNPKLVERIQGARPPARRSARASARRRPAATRCSTCRCPGRSWCTSMPAPRSSAGSTRRPADQLPAWASFAAPPRRLQAGRRPAPGRRRRGGPCRLSRQHRARADARRAATWARSWPGCASACPTTRSSPTAPATTPPGCNRFFQYRGFAPSSRRPAARWATACRRRSPPRSRTRAHVVVASPATAAS